MLLPHSKTPKKNLTQVYDYSRFGEVYDQRQNGSENYKVNLNGVVLVYAPAESLLSTLTLLDPELLMGDYPGLTELEEILKPQKPETRGTAIYASGIQRYHGNVFAEHLFSLYQYTEEETQKQRLPTTARGWRPKYEFFVGSCWQSSRQFFRLPGRNRAKQFPKRYTTKNSRGDYNIQLHLKDFQIIALVGEDSIGSLGDYDYNYDYSDFTVKPGTQKPSASTSSPSPLPPSSTPAPQKPLITVKPQNRPSQAATPISTQKPIENPLNKPENSFANQEKPIQSSVASNEVDKTEKSTVIIENSTIEKVGTGNSTNKTSDHNDETNSPGKIKVQIIETPVSVIPGEEVHEQNATVPGEIVQLRRCAQGFARDKKGRCRRLRRPNTTAAHLPYHFSRLASNLVSRFRHASPDASLSPSSPSPSESLED
ncbi:hypothetical protein NQ317_002620 [Molorchus minor]|uniref:Uncharacterized protein n=1 Tax=Molorchus minor TaxID=1323400 RepID=A0ABQ9IXL1_9CUCU|nr:hypothetical protein NQ317_002620 [Molorchus minor]